MSASCYLRVYAQSGWICAEEAPAAEVEAPLDDEVVEEPAVAEEPAPAEAVAVEADADVVDAEEPAAPEVPQPTEGALAAPDVPAVADAPAPEQVSKAVSHDIFSSTFSFLLIAASMSTGCIRAGFGQGMNLIIISAKKGPSSLAVCSL